MKILDVDMPQAIIDAHKRGKLVIFAGAGVSIDAPSNYPNFANLANEIGGAAHPKFENELIDRYLGRLEHEGLAVHDRVRHLLSDPDSRPNHLHESIISLFGTSQRIRVVTTNFDDHFRSVAGRMLGSDPQIYRAPALPLGNDFDGIVHLHGSVLEEAKKLVLTDADFGRAYLTEGWARRFVQRLFAEFVVLFVGYSHQDLPLLYLARGISAAEGGPGRYALTEPSVDSFWFNLGITPVHYPLRDAPLHRHGALRDCLAKWVELANLGALGTEAEIRRIVTSGRPESSEESDFLKQALLELSSVRYFTRHARDPHWLDWISEHPDFNAIFAPGASLNDKSGELSFWFGEYFAIQHFGAAIEVVRKKGETLSPNLWHNIAIAFHRHSTAGESLRFWTPILLETMPSNAQSDFLAYMIGHCTLPDDQPAVLQLFRKLTAPKLRLKRRFFPPDEGESQKPDAEVTPIGSDHWVTHVYQTNLRPHLASLANELSLIVTSSFEEARSLLSMYGKTGQKWDPISFSRGSTASRMQDHLRNAFSVLIDIGVDVLVWANENRPAFASALIGRWIDSEAPILRRLAITGMTHHPGLSPDEKLRWACSNKLVDDFGLKNEMFALLADVYARCGEEDRKAFLTQAEAAYPPKGEDYEQYELFNLLSWLHKHAPECPFATEILHRIQESQPKWTVREHPDFNSWISGGVRQLTASSPVPASRIEEMNLEMLCSETMRLALINDSFGDSPKDGFLQEVARAVSSNFAWSEGIAKEALANPEVPLEIWSALLRGWTSGHSEAEWKSLLAILAQLTPIYENLLYELASFLKGAITQNEAGLPNALIVEALPIANETWEACSRVEAALPDPTDSWVNIAINLSSGYLIEFYCDSLRSLWPGREEHKETISLILNRLKHMTAGSSPASEIARVLVPANADLLFALAPDWYQDHVLPLLAAPASDRSSEQSWDGFLFWGRWTQEMLPGLLPAYISHLPQTTRDSDERSRMYCGHLAGIAVFGVIDPIANGWLAEFVSRASRRERLHFASEMTQCLRGADQKAKDGAWNRWLKVYIQRRVQANPLPLDPEEAGSMCEWALVLKDHYAGIVESLVAGPAPSVKGRMFYYRLREDDVVGLAPALSAQLLTALLSNEDGSELWDLDQVDAMASQLIDIDPSGPTLLPLCEQLGRLGSNSALGFRNRLR